MSVVVLLLILCLVSGSMGGGGLSTLLCSLLLLSVFGSVTSCLVFVWHGCRLLRAVVNGLLSLCSLHFLRGWMASHNIYIYIHTHTYTYTLYIYIYICVCVFVCVYIYVCVYVCVCVYIYIYIYHSTQCEPSGIPNAHTHIVKNFTVVSLAWRWHFKSKHVALTYAFII